MVAATHLLFPASNPEGAEVTFEAQHHHRNCRGRHRRRKRGGGTRRRGPHLISVHPPGPGSRQSPRAVPAARDQEGAQRIFTTLVPASANRTTTAFGLSAMTEAGPLAKPWLPKTRHSCQLRYAKRGCKPATLPDRSRAASAVPA